MKVLKTPPAVVPAAKVDEYLLTWEEISTKEGVYSYKDGGSLLLTVANSSKTCMTLWYNMDGNLAPADTNWREYKFKKVEADVIFDIILK